MASNKKVNFQRFTVEQARKLIMESGSRLTDHLIDVDDNFSDESETE